MQKKQEASRKGTERGRNRDDRRQATKIREVISDGRVSSGYYIMSPSDNGLNRYILYTLKQDNSGAVIYIEGKLLPDDILKMCYQTR